MAEIMAVASGPVGPVLAGPIFSPRSHTHLSCCVEHAPKFKDLQLLRSPSSCYSLVEHIHGRSIRFFPDQYFHLVATPTLVALCRDAR